MFKKLIDRVVTSLETQMKLESGLAIERIAADAKEAIARVTQQAHEEADHRRNKMAEEYVAQLKHYDKSVREVQELTVIVDQQRKDLLHQTQRLEADINAMRAGTPDRLYEAAFNSGFSKGFDLALGTIQNKINEHIKKCVQEAAEKERARYDEAISKLTPLNRL